MEDSIKTEPIAEPSASVGGSVARVDAPFFYGSTFQLTAGPLDFSLIVGRQHPMFITPPEGPQQFGAALEAQAIIQMSPQTAKDLMLLLRDHISRVEAEYGVIQTPFSRELESK